jgi:hypothetical protein
VNEGKIVIHLDLGHGDSEGKNNISESCLCYGHQPCITYSFVSRKEEERETINSTEIVKVCVRGKMKARRKRNQEEILMVYYCYISVFALCSFTFV